ncbi:ADP-ribosylglycohydrolase family protein [Kovacikia minuta CCNUW1]|uniref:ADP-ribosylglycohydrolase family protein n=1 Tax=Kovacikia minuta TaxID=2931930 RepID=UPI001CCD6EDA|nr:ADP-ribosylglycohydrolase family protein [Kovacikia minuta]UBF26651.1 ADP-ribosylglycohydrolase family protein [Kovacikia minuta CCNUW1]
MRYSLLSRFQGALLGAALGDRLGFEFQKQPSHLNYGKTAIDYAEALIHWGGQNGLGLGQTNHQFSAPEKQSQSPLNQAQLMMAAEWAIATLPIALFFHDDEIKLQQTLQTLVNGQGYGGLQGGVLTSGFAIAQALQERLKPLDLIPRTIAYLQRESTPTDSDSDLITKLQQGQSLLQEGRDLHTALRVLLPTNQSRTGNRAISLALFCFLSTPEDMRLTLLRAVRCGSESRMVCALTGALAGAYNSAGGIPVEWSLSLSKPSQILDWQISGPEICYLSERLLAAWSGVYDPTISSLSHSAIAAPGIIRPR